MKKKLFTLLTLMMCAVSGAWAQINVGFTSTYDGEGAIYAPTLTTQSDITVALAHGSQTTDKNKGSMYWGSTTELTYNTDNGDIIQNRTKYNGAALATATLYDEVWTGASYAIASGKKFTVSDITLDFAGQDYEWKYRLDVVNGDGTVEYTATGTVATPKNASKRKITATGKSIVLTGTAYVRLHYTLNTTSSDSKYMYVPELYLTGIVEDNIQTNYTKPSIVQGAYDQPTGKYAVTLSVQNDEDGTINYTVGTDAEVTDAPSGTVINVDPGTKITAYVTGATYANSDETELTTDAAPTLATPTYTIGSYDLFNNLYTVTLAAAAGDIIYTAAGGSETAYTSALTLTPGTAMTAFATQTNMTQSATLNFSVPAAPTGGTATSPNTDGAYTNNTSYTLGGITIPGACIAGQISSSSTPINKSIKTRCNQTLSDSKVGFYVNVNSGYTVTGISIQGCSNQTGDNTCTAVYVDGVAVGGFSSVVLPLAAKGGSTGTINVTGINATNKIEFAFENSDQAQMNITVTYGVSDTKALGTVVTGFTKAFATFCALQNFTVTGATAYKAAVSGSNLVLTALDGVIPANTAVIIAGEGSADYTITYVSDAATADVTGNELLGTAVRTETATLAGSKQLLALESASATFKEYTGTYFPACKAYLLNGAGARELTLTFDDTVTSRNEELRVENGESSPAIYNLSGQRVAQPQKGLYIINGKKVLMK